MTDYDMNDPICSLAYRAAWRDPAVQSVLQRHESRNEALLDPEFNAAFDAAFETAHNATTADPFEHERAEAIHLRDKVQSDYSKTGLAWQYLGEASPPLAVGVRLLYGMGYWTGDETMPNDIAAVSSLLQCLASIDRGPTQSGRMLMAKRLNVLLLGAQKVCKAVPQPPTYCRLTEKQKEVVSILWSNGVRSIHDCVKRGFIMKHIANRNPDQARDPDDTKDDLKALRQLGLVCKNGERAAMTYWLSAEGMTMGEYLHNT